MHADGPELLGLALSLEAAGTDDDEVVTSLLEAARCSVTALMGACTHALSLSRDMPYDETSQRTLDVLTRAAQQAVRMSVDIPSEDRAPLLDHIVEISGRAAVAPGAVASRTAEVDADMDHLRPPGDSPTGDSEMPTGDSPPWDSRPGDATPTGI